MSMATDTPIYFSLGYACEQLGADPVQLVDTMKDLGLSFREVRNGIGQLDREAFEQLKNRLKGTDE